MINFRGVTPIFVPAVWSLKVPPRVHFFLWLLSKNKLLTRDNLEKRRRVDDNTCLFCSEKETTHHLFFECVVSAQTWKIVSDVVGFQIGHDFESIARCWLCNTMFGTGNMLSLTVCWSLSKLRNSMCFQGAASWEGMKAVWRRVLPILKCWKVLVPMKTIAGFEDVISSLEVVAWRPELITDGETMQSAQTWWWWTNESNVPVPASLM
jgi:hypothetical protein